MKRIILRSMLIFCTILSVSAHGQDVYWREGFEGGGISTTNPTSGGPNNYYAVSVNSPGSWFLHNTYRTTGTPCGGVYGANHLRLLNVTITTPADSAYVVLPIVDFGVREVHMSRCQTTTTRRVTIWVRADTIGNQNVITGTGWTRIASTFTSTNLNQDTSIIIPAPFNATTRRVAISLSQASNADIDSIYLVSNTAITTPVTFNGISANFNNAAVKVLWSNETEENTSRYEIERSAEGRSFSSIGSVVATSVRKYSYVDYSPITGSNFYRIKAIDRDGKITISSVIRVNTGKSTAQIMVSPNPVENNLLNLQLSNLKAGNYTLAIYNASGQSVYKSVIRNEGVSLSQSIKLPSVVTPGVYTLRLSDGLTNEQKVISVR